MGGGGQGVGNGDRFVSPCCTPAYGIVAIYEAEDIDGGWATEGDGMLAMVIGPCCGGGNSGGGGGAAPGVPSWYHPEMDRETAAQLT